MSLSFRALRNNFHNTISYSAICRPATRPPACLVEGEKSECDIAYDLEYGYVDKLKDVLADLSEYDTAKFEEDMLDPAGRVLPECRNGGCIVINMDEVKATGIK